MPVNVDRAKSVEVTSYDVKVYLESVHRLTVSLANHDEDLPIRCREVTERYQKIYYRHISENWSAIYAELSTCSAALINNLGQVKSVLEEQRHKLRYYDFKTPEAVLNQTVGEILAPMTKIDSILASILPFFRRQREDELRRRREEIIRRKKEELYEEHVRRVEKEDATLASRLERLEHAVRWIEKSRRFILDADNRKDAPSECPPEVKVEAVSSLNEAVTRVVMMDINFTMQVDGSKPVPCRIPNVTFNLPADTEKITAKKPLIGVVLPDPKLASSQINRHRKICDLIGSELEFWRIDRNAAAKRYDGHSGRPVYEPSMRELTENINRRNKHTPDWNDLDQRKVQRHLEYALGMPIDTAKWKVNPVGKVEPNSNSDWQMQIDRKAAEYADAKIRFYWAGLSLGSINFADAKLSDIEHYIGKYEGRITFDFALSVVQSRWP